MGHSSGRADPASQCVPDEQPVVHRVCVVGAAVLRAAVVGVMVQTDTAVVPVLALCICISQLACAGPSCGTMAVDND